MHFGFDMGVNTVPAYTYTPLNHNSALSYPNHVLSHIHNELSLHRYSGPFSLSRLQSLIGNFRTSPLSTRLSEVQSRAFFADLDLALHARSADVVDLALDLRGPGPQGLVQDLAPSFFRNFFSKFHDLCD